MDAVIWILRITGLYLAAGLVFAIFFVSWGVSRIDPAARGAHPAFRLLIFPGAVALWPVLLLKWAKPRVPQEKHS